MSLPAVASASWCILWLQLTSLSHSRAVGSLLHNFCSLSLCVCAVFSFDWAMNSRKWITSHHFISKHRFLSILTGGRYRQHETLILSFSKFSVLLWKQITSVMKNWQSHCKICGIYFTYLSPFGNHFLFSGSMGSYHIMLFRCSENCKWRVCFIIQVTIVFPLLFPASGIP